MYISQIELPGGTTYHLKDTDARDLLASALIFKGAVSTASGITSLTNYKKGWTYKVSSAFVLNNKQADIGDIIICTYGRSSYNANDWIILQGNLDDNPTTFILDAGDANGEPTVLNALNQAF